jgi:RNA polymerase sigma factor (sigma-70 family)
VRVRSNAERQRAAKGRPAFTGGWRAFAAEFDYLRRTLRRHGVPAQEVEDTVQDVFLTMWRRWAHYDPSRALRPWLAGIAVHLAQHRARGSGRTVPLGDRVLLDPAPDPEESLGRRRQRALVLAVLKTLPEKHRGPLVLHEFDGLSVGEIARLSRIHPSTAWARVRAGRTAFEKTLRRFMRAGGAGPLRGRASCAG